MALSVPSKPLAKQPDLSVPVFPLDFALTGIASLCLQIPLFRPTWSQIFLAYGVHLVVTGIFTNLFNKRLMTYFLPRYQSLVPNIDDTSFTALPAEARESLIQAAMRFPLRHALLGVGFNLLLVIPSILIITFYWNREFSYLGQFFLAISLSLLTFVHFFIAMLVYAHHFLSRRILELHTKFDLSAAFRSVKIPGRSNDVLLIEGFAVLFLALCSLAVSLIVWLRSSPDALQEILLINTVTLVIFIRMWFLGRSFFWEGMERIIREVNALDVSSRTPLLPLHTIESLAQLEKSFNTMIDRGHSYQIELNRWISHGAEESRLNAIGELAALIVHDLSTPLHVIRLCAQKLRDDPESAKLGKHTEFLNSSVNQAIDLVTTLRSYMRHEIGEGMCLGTALTHTIRVLDVKFSMKPFKTIQWEADTRLNGCFTTLGSAEVIQILDNLLSNSTNNLLENKITAPAIKVRLIEDAEEHFKVEITDNGTGLTPERFEHLTGLPTQSDLAMKGSSMGLRLVRRIIERQKGTITVLPTAHAGTTISLTLPRR
jgi:signal transduction histidine kinase